ncbi:FkbM family methyltransferase [Synechococcus elongatus]|uniref:FkbM family methyltransferase n=1 Tax=Synechococcus elongatus PCC 11802 TaxID=2283154 RepID=A0AAT9JVK0_SYNEL|nr:FkbM family methyltransferase [Synechococcus elongatus]QFZ91312.1 FkbM family methyltransferase [Synechococcus elongatus PCC 11802]
MPPLTPRYLRNFIDQSFPNLSRWYRNQRDRRLFQRDSSQLQKYLFDGREYKFYGDSLKQQFLGRTNNGELSSTKALLREGFDVFVDIGANHGLFSLLALHEPRCQTIISVEPCYRNYQLLVRNLSLQNSEKEVFAFHLAVGSAINFQLLYGGLEGASLLTHWGSIRSTYAEQVQVLSLDRLASLWQFRDRQALIKIDAEGLEPEILLGAQQLIQAGKTTFIVELSLTENQSSPNNKSYIQTFEAMLNQGMSAFTFPGGASISLDAVKAWTRADETRSVQTSAPNYPDRTLNILFRPHTN